MAENGQKLEKSYHHFFRKLPYLKNRLSYNFCFGLKLTGAYRLTWVSIQDLGRKPTDFAAVAKKDFAKKSEKCHDP